MGVAARKGNVHTPSMTLKQASFLAFIGTLLLSILLVADVILNLLSMARGLIPAVTLLTSLIHTFAAVSVAVFFYAFHRAQS
jgi:multidrug efflux pump subunit AcrB